MRIGINALAWVSNAQAGVDTYVRQLLNALQQIDQANEYIVFVAGQAHGELDLAAGNFREVACPIPSRWQPVRALWEQIRLVHWVKAEAVQVLLGIGGIVPTNLAIPAVQVIHDLQVFRYPENFSWAKRKFLQMMLPCTAQHAQLTIASSEYTRNEVVRFLPPQRADTRVALLAGARGYEPAEPEAVTAAKHKYGVGERYLLNVATSHRHKNLQGLVAAWNQSSVDADVVLVGKRGSGHRELMQEVATASCPGQIKLLGWIPQPELAALYTGATAFVLPSLLEGFGMTVLEAMQCGCPVACSSLTALPEVVGQAALCFDPRRSEDFVAALDRISNDQLLRQRLQQEGFARARRFSWEQTARTTVAALLEAGEQHAGRTGPG